MSQQAHCPGLSPQGRAIALGLAVLVSLSLLAGVSQMADGQFLNAWLETGASLARVWGR